MELVLWVLTATGVWAYLKGYDDAAGVLWGLAAAMKLYPAVLLMLLLPRGRWRAFALGVAAFVAATVLALWWLGPTMGVAWRGSLQNVFGYQGLRASEWSLRELAANHSAFRLVKLVAMIGRAAGVADAALLWVWGGGDGAAFFGRLWRMPEANQLLAVTTFMVMFPPVSYFHTLVHMYAPLLVLLFVGDSRGAGGGAGCRVARDGTAVCAAVCGVHAVPVSAGVFFDGLVQAALLVAIFGCAVRYPFAAGEGVHVPMTRGVG